MRFRNLEIEGFRGINQPIKVSLDGPVIVVSGPNGAGKTTVFEAIEWCLFGRLDLSGAEFQREDAIVNDFHSDEKARVVLTLGDGIVVTRTRKKKGRTGFGKRDSDLEVAWQGELLKGEEAQDLIIELLGLTIDDYGAIVHLHQETIRSFIQGTPAQRSQTIDKMIGLFHLRELISGLDPGVIEKEITQLEERAETIDRTMLQATILSREMVAEQESALEQDGIPMEEISEERLLAALHQISEELGKLATVLEAPSPALEPLSMEGARQVVSQAKGVSRELGELRFRRFSQAEQAVGELTRLQEQLGRAARDLESVAGMDVATLGEQLEEAVRRKEELQARLSELNTGTSNLRNLQQRVATTGAAIEQTTTRLHGLGSLEGAEADLRDTQNELETLVAATETTRALETLLPAAAEYLHAARPDDCPVCKQTIPDLEGAIQHLQQEVLANKEAQRAQELQNQQRALEDVERELKRRIGDIKTTDGELNGLRKELAAIKVEMEQLTGVPPSDPLSDFVVQQLSTFEGETRSIQQEVSEIDVGLTTIEGRLDSRAEKQELLQQCRIRIAQELDIPADTEDLVTPLQGHIEGKQSQLRELEALADVFAGLGGSLDQVEPILDILEARQRLTTLEQKYPTALEEKNALQRVIKELRDLQLGLQDICQAATVHQRSVVGGALANLQPVINERYGRILGHPEYTELQIEPEEQKGVHRYWIAARNPQGTHSTYVSTRFSTAQRNVAAVAIFLAMADHLPHTLDVLMMDDPTQSMDPEHRRAMAQFLADEGENKQVIVGTEDPDFAEMIVEASETALHYPLNHWTAMGTTLNER